MNVVIPILIAYGSILTFGIGCYLVLFVILNRKDKRREQTI